MSLQDKHQDVGYILISPTLKDKDFPWNIRVGYAKDIAAGMVSLWSQYKEKRSYSTSYVFPHLYCFSAYKGLSALHECYSPRSKLIQLPGQRGKQVFFVLFCFLHEDEFVK